MPKVIPFELVKVFENKYDLDLFTSKLPPSSCYKSNKVKHCHICNRIGCQMKVQYVFCSSELCNTSHSLICPCRYKIEICEKNETVYFSKAFEHLFDHTTKKENRRRHGLTPQAKEIAEQIIFHHGITKPNRIQSAMNNKFKDLIDHMPTLKQVQNYVKTRRKKFGENSFMLDDGASIDIDNRKINLIKMKKNEKRNSNQLESGKSFSEDEFDINSPQKNETLNGHRNLTMVNDDEDNLLNLKNNKDEFCSTNDTSFSITNDDNEDNYDEIEMMPTPAEAYQMFHGLKRFLSKYTPDSNDLIFDLEKKVNQGIENNKKITKFSLS